MELLIIGASGYIGGEIYQEAKNRNVHVTGTGCGSVYGGLLKFDISSNNIAGIAGAFSMREKYAVVCSAQPNIDACYNDYEHAYNVNVISTKRLLSDLKGMGFKTVFLSTDNVFDGKDGYYDESETPVPINKYGAMKREIEQYMINNLPNDVVLRISKIIGDKPHKKNPLTEWRDAAKQGKPIRCIEGNIFSPTDVSDIVKCIFIALESDLRGLYNVCNDEHFERIELARQFFRTMSIVAEPENKPIEFFNFKDGRPLKSYLCNDKFKKETGYCFRSVKDVMIKYKENVAKGSVL